MKKFFIFTCMLFVWAILVASPAAAKNSYYDDRDLALKAFRKDDPSTAIGLLTPYAEQGNLDAQTLLAQFYRRNGDHRQAVNWLMLANKSNYASPLTKLLLGDYYESGEGVGRDYVKAYNLYCEAHNKVLEEEAFGKEQTDEFRKWHIEKVGKERSDLIFKMINYLRIQMGTFYYNGQGVDKNIDKAYYWIYLVAQAGDVQAESMLKEIEQEQQMTPDNIRKIVRESTREHIFGSRVHRCYIHDPEGLKEFAKQLGKGFNLRPESSFISR